ncbi:RNA polymerase sigma factor [Sphingomonas naphthae]|uniref:RNA polymerase sigma factor n=1 Tax=Sphingomonas naphthae TaxID=1813468 RepID=A0ABY7THV7_9SPHN|nr:RNA polymerase sigma factor [Sphingomonas naphthae]WCT72811.1 RNA polymerase sigma factor [Sphingomonas naphthae]
MSADDPDAALLAQVAAGEAASVRRLVAAKAPRLMALAGRLLDDRGEAEDVTQEAFVRLWKVAPRWRTGQAKVDTWLHGITLNLCRDRLRRRRETVTDTPPDRADPAPLADVALIADERDARVAAAIAALPERQREAILLQYYQDLGNIAAAEVMGVSVEALESLLSRARRTLRARLMEGAGDDA